MLSCDKPALKDLTKYLIGRSTAAGCARFVLGIAGPPGAGKSTAAEALVRAVNAETRDCSKAAVDDASTDASTDALRGSTHRDIAVVAPMDGFHRYNSELELLKLRDLKGVPDSFDSDGFLAKLAALKKHPGQALGWPTFDRAIEEPTVDGTFIEPHHKLVIVEGNYLLLDKSPWDKVRGLLDEIWYLDCDIDTIEPRLIARHMAGGKDESGARAKVNSTDLPNARLIDASKINASRILKFPQLPL